MQLTEYFTIANLLYSNHFESYTYLKDDNIRLCIEYMCKGLHNQMLRATFNSKNHRVKIILEFQLEDEVDIQLKYF